MAGATEKQLVRQVEYLKAENEILRSKLPKRITVTVGGLLKHFCQQAAGKDRHRDRSFLKLAGRGPYAPLTIHACCHVFRLPFTSCVARDFHWYLVRQRKRRESGIPTGLKRGSNENQTLSKSPVLKSMVVFRHDSYNRHKLACVIVASPIHCNIGIPTCVARS